MITKELGILIIITAIIIALMYAKMILIWKEVMLTKKEKIRKDMERLHYLKKNRHK